MNRIVEQALKVTEGDRFEHYGAPEDNHARTEILWNAYEAACAVGGKKLTFPPGYKVCVFNILQKLARGIETPDHEDSFVDIIGYTLNMARIMGVGQEDLADEASTRCEYGGSGVVPADPLDVFCDNCPYPSDGCCKDADPLHTDPEWCNVCPDTETGDCCSGAPAREHDDMHTGAGYENGTYTPDENRMEGS